MFAPTQYTRIPLPNVIDDVDAGYGQAILSRRKPDWNTRKEAVVSPFEKLIHRNSRAKHPGGDPMVQIDPFMAPAGQIDALRTESIEPSPMAAGFRLRSDIPWPERSRTQS